MLQCLIASVFYNLGMFKVDIQGKKFKGSGGRVEQADIEWSNKVREKRIFIGVGVFL